MINMKPTLRETYRKGETPTSHLRGKLTPVFFLVELIQHRDLNLGSMSEDEFDKVLSDTLKQVNLESIRNSIEDAADLLRFYSNGTYGSETNER